MINCLFVYFSNASQFLLVEIIIYKMIDPMKRENTENGKWSQIYMLNVSIFYSVANVEENGSSTFEHGYHHFHYHVITIKREESYT